MQLKKPIFVAILVLVAVSGAGAQNLSLSRPNRPGRTSNDAPGANPGQPFSISPTSLWGGVQGTDYQANLTTAFGTAPIAWSITSGALPPGVTLNTSTGEISGVPSSAGLFAFTIKASDVAAKTVSRGFTVNVSPNNDVYGNTGGGVYATEGGAPSQSATVIMSCQTAALNADTVYRLGQNLTAATPGARCLTLNRGVKIDLGNFTVSGRIYLNGNPSSVVLFNGTVNCNWPDSGGDSGCITILGEGVFTGEMRLHHLNVTNTGSLGRGIHIDWTISGKQPGNTMRVFNNTILVPSQPQSIRSFAIALLGNNHSPEFFSNDLTCAADAGACQGIMCYNTADCKFHHNRINLITNTTPEGGRGLLFDGGTQGGEAWNNLITSNNNRALRIRDSSNIRVHHNKFKSIAANGAGAIHLADPDAGKVNDLNTLIDNNDFELAGGTVVFMRNGSNAIFKDNTFTCVGACNNSKLASLRTPIAPGNISEVIFQNNLGIILVSGPPQTLVETGATARTCNSGQAGGTGAVVNAC